MVSLINYNNFNSIKDSINNLVSSNNEYYNINGK